ncbi:hypothetical protein [Pimelobacter simplex]|uniref:hypothetical protein n=1 Tax=Nocardioides simplex TaxID=2045 RepID=UPI00215014C3|nr:hypothetical protein [Pimelobacter simplex]UUW91654.1 hypothetical protein M0M43_09245 [Pimelobacter simplex]UUW95482.1 hypothetical protein M0M48_27745 [Pimelobacter simplex]
MRLADGTTLLHIGPYKTGTTAMQGALWEARDALAEHGVRYPGERAHEMGAAMAVALGRVEPGQDLAEQRERWHALAAELRDERPRIGIVSSEVYCEASDEGARAVLDGLGPATQVLITLRPVVRLLGSQWQQYTQNIAVPSYPDWLREILDHPEGERVTPSFWRRHRHDRLVERWVGLVGPERVTVVVVDDRDHDGLPRVFEELLGVPAGLLQTPADRSNRSLTFPETQLVQALVRRTNGPAFGPAFDSADHSRFVRFGAARGLQAAPADRAAERVLTPAWAVDQALAIGASMAARVAASGATVIGDLGLLSDPALAPATGDNAPVTAVDPVAAAALVAGVISKLSGVRGGPEPRVDGGPVEKAVWSRHHAVVAQWESAPPSAAPAERSSLRALAGRVRRRLGGSR